MRVRLGGLLVVALLTLSACSARIVPAAPGTASQSAPKTPQPTKPVPATPTAPVAATPGTGPSGRTLGVVAGPALDTLFSDQAGALRALKTFRSSCPALLRRTDNSGLTSGQDWQGACAAAAGWAEMDAVNFFARNFEMAQVGDGKAFATGYYEPEIAGSRVRTPGYDVPIYRRPPELVEVDLGQFSDTLKGKKIRGRVSGNTFVPFDDRTKIEEGSLAGRGLEIAWAADAVDFFVLQIQGSGRLKQPDGSVMRIAYDGQNGRDYTGIGKLMRERGLLQPGKATMDDLTDWIRAHPEEGRGIMRENRSWVFFRELTGPGPVGSLNLPITARGSVATDPMFVPLGAPVLLSMDRGEATGLWIAQDTGGAIKGSNRFDTFWGTGTEAKHVAGGMASHGTAFVLLPIGTVARLQQEALSAPPSPR